MFIESVSKLESDMEYGGFERMEQCVDLDGHKT